MDTLVEFQEYLTQAERSSGTIQKYVHDVMHFRAFLGNTPLSKQAVINWKESLLTSGRAIATINSMLVAVNQYLRFIGAESYRVHTFRQQRQIFRPSTRELSRTEYRRLVETAAQLGRTRLCLLLQTICSTGIRVSEVRNITVESVKMGRAEIRLKGKSRIILLPNKLCRALLKYTKRQKIASGEIFLTRSGSSLSRKQIWHEMKQLCTKAGVAPTKVFPHNLRHLFAATFYEASHDLVKLADVLGHSSLETTRIYLITCGIEHIQYLERLNLLC